MKFLSLAVRASAAILLVSAGIGGGAAVAATTSPTAPPGSSEIDRYTEANGPTFVADQQKLSDFKHWVTSVPGVEEAGYVEPTGQQRKHLVHQDPMEGPVAST